MDVKNTEKLEKEIFKLQKLVAIKESKIKNKKDLKLFQHKLNIRKT